MDPRTRKDSIRRLILSRRARLDEGARAQMGAAVAERLLGLPEAAAADSILAFVSIRSEVPTDLLLSTILDSGKTLLLPFVAEDGALRAAAVGSFAELEPGFRGIPEPRSRLPVEAASAGLIVTPGVAFDPAGGRLGYGGGFYDAFLAAAPTVTRVGVCFDLQIVPDVPRESHDERVDVVVTETRVMRAHPAR